MTNFEFCNSKRKINKILKEYEDNKGLLELDYDDDTELCFYREGNFSVYLAVYDGTLTWTFSQHFEDSGDFDNVGEILYQPHKPNLTTQDLKELCEIVLPIAFDWYIKLGGYDCVGDMPFIQLEGLVGAKVEEMYKQYLKDNQDKDLDCYSRVYTYDDICVIVAVMDFIQQYDTELDSKIPDTEDIIALANTIKKEWEKEFSTLSHEEQGYIGAYAHRYLRDMYL